MPSIINLVNKTFGQLRVIEKSEEVFKTGVHWKCVCSCGKEVIVRSQSLRTGATISCGCYKQNRPYATIKHGHSRNVKSPEYMAWCSMKNRCSREIGKNSKYYIEKGIVVCERWINSFDNFLEDMGERPTKNHSLDRINTQEGYCKENCRWATKQEQSYNTDIQRNNTSGRTGVQLSKTGIWIASITFNYKTIYLGSFASFENACKAREIAELKYFGKIKK